MALKARVSAAWLHPYPGGFMLTFEFFDLLTPNLVLRRASANFDEAATQQDVAAAVKMLGESYKREPTPRALDAILAAATVYDAENPQADI